MTKPIPVLSTDSWQTQLRQVVSSAGELLTLLNLEPGQVNVGTRAGAEFPLRVPRAFVRRMRAGDPRDPLLLQVLASAEEERSTAGYSRDPVGESGETIPHAGIIHKYRGRVLLMMTGSCAINCRYCFRRHFPYAENRNSRDQWRQALAHIERDPSIDEVILSGGDPLIAGDALLADMADQLAGIDHLRRLRIHSRLPVVLPDRITPGFLDAICNTRLQTVMVIHCNHPNEIDADVARGVAAMKSRGVTVLNQSVLLREINDEAGTLIDLSQRLFTAGVLPYYLHLMDKVQGAAHFDVSESRARQLMVEIAAQLPGYLVPRLVREETGASAKTAIPL
jgi:EF-P beta-lysylation protein EpmB